MARTPRLFVPGYPSHVVHRGNNRQKIFHSETDYRFLWRCMKEAADEFQVAVNAYVFMANHLHLLLTPGDPSAISNAMHSASRRYAGYFNHRYERTGTLWEGRFHASLVTTDHYLFSCHRYIDLNPVRAGLVVDPSAYPWSSHRFYTMDEANPLITPHPAITALGRERNSVRAAYRSLFLSPLEGADLYAIRRACLAGTPIGAQTAPRGRKPKKCVPDTNFYFVPDTNF
jgi:putative transposase